MTLFVRDVGQGEAVVLIHGIGASHRAFDAVIASAPPSRFRFLAVDLPGVGKSEHWASSEPAQIAQTLGEYLRATLGVARYRLFGHSFGGLVALSLAALQPSAVLRVVVASSPALGLPSLSRKLLGQPALSRTHGLLRRLPTPRFLVKQYLQWLWGDAVPLSESAVAVGLHNARDSRFMVGMLESLRAMAAYQLPLAALQTARFGKHVLWGDRDQLVSPVEGERLSRALGASFSVLAGVGHCVAEEAPLAVLSALEDEAQVAPRAGNHS